MSDANKHSGSSLKQTVLSQYCSGKKGFVNLPCDNIGGSERTDADILEVRDSEGS